MEPDEDLLEAFFAILVMALGAFMTVLALGAGIVMAGAAGFIMAGAAGFMVLLFGAWVLLPQAARARTMTPAASRAAFFIVISSFGKRGNGMPP
jgi:hypothetical protein